MTTKPHGDPHFQVSPFDPEQYKLKAERMSTLKPGDAVEYSKRWLRCVGLTPWSEAANAKGVVVCWNGPWVEVDFGYAVLPVAPTNLSRLKK